MPENRHTIAARAAATLQQADLSQFPCVLGFDGFVDSIIHVVDKRHNATTFDRVATITAMAQKMAAAAGESANYELVPILQKLGGNGPIMAHALAQAGCGVTYLGALGKPDIHPAFQDFARTATLHSLADPAFTDALEFDDGKLMLGKLLPLSEITYQRLIDQLGSDSLLALLSTARLIATVNWTMLPHLTQLWQSLQSEILPHLPPASRTLFIDLADPEKRTAEDLRQALATLAKFQSTIPTILGLNLKESTQVAAALGIPVPADTESHIASTAAAIRQKLAIACVVIHPRRGAAAADHTGSAFFPGPFVAHPKISTGAGDHFNAGFCLARILNMPLPESLCTGTALSGFYVRHAKSPTKQELVAFLNALPEAE